jgi:NAD(P)H-nitrite reductase large subunit
MLRSSPSMETVPKYTMNILDAPPDEPVCWCGLVSKKRVIDAIRNGAATLDDIRKRTGACTIGRCKEFSPRGRCCSKELMALLADHLNDKGDEL